MRRKISQYENLVDALVPPLNPGESYYVRVKNEAKRYRHYITNENGVPFLVGVAIVPSDPPIVTVEDETYICGENINSCTPVVLVNQVLFKMDYLTPIHQFSFVGFTATSGTLGNTVAVKTRLIELNGWGLIPNVKYLAGPDGSLITSNTVPDSFTKVIGFSQGVNRLLIIKDYTSILKT
jgi:hypothetical protein